MILGPQGGRRGRGPAGQAETGDVQAVTGPIGSEATADGAGRGLEELFQGRGDGRGWAGGEEITGGEEPLGGSRDPLRRGRAGRDPSGQVALQGSVGLVHLGIAREIVWGDLNQERVGHQLGAGLGGPGGKEDGGEAAGH